MVANREGISKVGKDLAELVIMGGAETAAAVRLARRLVALCEKVGAYDKQYETHEERVLMRHLNLYRNKLAKAETEPQRLRWRAKLIEQEQKVAAFKSADLDLDGL